MWQAVVQHTGMPHRRCFGAGCGIQGMPFPHNDSITRSTPHSRVPR